MPAQPQPLQTGSAGHGDGLDDFFGSYQKAQAQQSDGLDDFFSDYQRANAPLTAGRVASEAGRIAGQAATGAVRMGGLALSTVARVADAAASLVDEHPDLQGKVFRGMEKIINPMKEMYDFKPGEEPSFAGKAAGGILSTPISMLSWPEGGIERYEQVKAAGGSEEEAVAAGLTRAEIGAAQQLLPAEAGAAAAGRIAGPIAARVTGAATGAGIGVATGAAGRGIENLVTPEDMPQLKQKVIPSAAEAALEAIPGGIFGILGAGHGEAPEPTVEAPGGRTEPAMAPPEEVAAAPAPKEEAPPSGGEPRKPEEELKGQPVKSDRQQELERLRELAAEPEVQQHLDKEIVKEQAASKKAFETERKQLSAQDQAAEFRRLAGQTSDPELSKQFTDQAEKLSPTPKPSEPETPAVESEPAGAARVEPQPQSTSLEAPSTPEPAAAPPQHTQGTSPFFRAIRDELGGVHTSERDDAGFDKAAPVMLGGRGPDGKARGPLFNGNGASMDRLVEWLHGRGYLTDADISHADEQTPGGSHQLAYDMLQREKANPGSVVPMRDQSARWQGVTDVQRQRELLDAADKAAVETQGRTLESIERDLWAAEDHAHAQQFGHPPEHMMTALAAHLDPNAVERLAVQHENDEPAFHQAIRELVNAHTEHVDTSGLGRGLEPGPGRAAEEPAVRAEHPEATAVQGEPNAVRNQQGAGNARPGERAEAGPAVPRAGAERGGAPAAETRGAIERTRQDVGPGVPLKHGPETHQKIMDLHVGATRKYLDSIGLNWLHKNTKYEVMSDAQPGVLGQAAWRDGVYTIRLSPAALERSPNEVAHAMLHEHAHILDLGGNTYSNYPEWSTLSPNLGEKKTWWTRGAIADEISKATERDPQIAALFDYPLNEKYAGHKVLGGLRSDDVAPELFAQAFAGYHSSLKGVMEREVPQTTKFIEQAQSHSVANPAEIPRDIGHAAELAESVPRSFDAYRSDRNREQPGAGPGDVRERAAAKLEQPRGMLYQHYQGVKKPDEEMSAMRLKDSLQKTLAPASRGGFAEETAGIMRANYGEQARQQAVAETRLKQAAAAFDQRPAAQNMDFIDRMERNQQQATPKLQAAATALRDILDKKLAEVQQLGTGALNHFIQNYFPHMWAEKDEALKDIYSVRRPMQGSKAFLKERTIPFTKDGLRWRAYDSDGSFKGSFDTEAQAKAAMPPGGRVGRPLTPVSNNPVEMVLLKAREMDRYIYAQRIFGEMGNAGFLQKVPHGQSGPAGWSPINDNIAHAGDGRYWAPEEAARLVNNHLSPGLQGNAAFQMWRQAGNLLNTAQLGLSAYHLGFTTQDAMTSKAALGIKQLSRGDVGKGIGSIAQSLNPYQPISNYLKGDRLLRAYLGQLHDPGLVPVLAALQDAGGRVRQDPFYSNEAVKAFNQAGALGKVRHALPALAELINKPIFENIVPRQKLGVFTDMAKDWLQANPSATIEERRAGLGKLWDSVDNRLGQIVYDNLFWNRTLKDALFASVRSVGWNLGTFRELGGGVLDLKDIAKNKQLSDRTAYLFALPMMTAVFGGITQAIYGAANGLSKDEWMPKDAKDLFFPRTFKQRPDGSEDRVSLPTYMKDVVAYAHDPVQTLANKANPLISLLGQELSNKDFFGAAISDPGDPKYKQWLDKAAYAGREMLPFSWQNYVQQSKAAGKDPDPVGWLTSPQQIGLSPAPGYVTKSPEQETSAELSAAHEPLRQRYVQELRTGTDRSEVIAAAQRSGFTKREIQMMLHQADRTGGPRRLRAFGGQAAP